MNEHVLKEKGGELRKLSFVAFIMKNRGRKTFLEYQKENHFET